MSSSGGVLKPSKPVLLPDMGYFAVGVSGEPFPCGFGGRAQPRAVQIVSRAEGCWFGFCWVWGLFIGVFWCRCCCWLVGLICLGFFFANAWKIIIITWKITGFPCISSGVCGYRWGEVHWRDRIAPAHPGHLAQDGNVPSRCLCRELFKP